MLLLNVGETLEEYTRSRSEGALIEALLDLPETAQLLDGDEERQVPASELVPGDLIAVRTGMPVCVDGEVVRGTAMVNQAALTGEPLSVERVAGDNVFAGTRRGGRRDRRAGDGGRGRDEAALHRVVGGAVGGVQVRDAIAHGAACRPHRAVELPSGGHRGARHAQPRQDVGRAHGGLLLRAQADRLHRRAVGYAAKRPGRLHGEGVEALRGMARADTIVFDKTGTLTEATPKVACVLALDGWKPPRGAAPCGLP